MAATNDDLESWLVKITEWTRRGAEALEQGSPRTPGGATAAGGPAAVGALPGLTTGPARIVGLFGALEKALTSFAGQVTKFVALAAPVTVMRFNAALADLQAVIGKALVPVLERVTQLVRGLADGFVSLSPQAKQLAAGLGVGVGLGGAFAALAAAGKALVAVFGGLPVLVGTLVASFVGVASTMASGKAIMSAFGAVVKAVGSVIDTVAKAVLPLLEAVLVPALHAVADIIRGVADKVRELARAARELLNLGAEEEPSKSSVGAAARSAQVGDIQSYISRAYTNAYQMGTGEDYARTTATTLGKIWEWLKNSEFATRTRPWAPAEDSWASMRPWGEAAGRAVGAPNTGRALGRGVDYVTGFASFGPRVIVESLRQLFG